MAWRDAADRAAGDAQLAELPSGQWRTELDAVERRVHELDAAILEPRPDDGLRAFVVLVAARLGDVWQVQQLIDVAAAVELAHRATRHHREIADLGGGRGSLTTGANNAAVLAGDWAITQAAVLVAGVGPDAYRLLVRGYGATQAGQLSGDPVPRALLDAAVGLGALVSAAPDDAVAALYAELGRPRSPIARVIGSVFDLLGFQSAGATKAASSDESAAVRQVPSMSITTRPAVGRP